MKTITQKMKFRKYMLRYCKQKELTATAIKYNTNREYVYRWKRRYNRIIGPMADRSHRLRSHPNQHKEEELKLISDMRKRNPNADLVVFWVKIMQRGYKRSTTGLYRVLKRNGQMAIKSRNPKYKPKPYEKMTYPEQCVQINVKHVPASCIVTKTNGSKKFYQYTAIYECTRFLYVEDFDEISAYSSAAFLDNMLEVFKFEVECVQTDNGTEFTNRFISHKSAPTLFELRLKQSSIQHKLISPFTPHHNGKVERSLRKDNEYFYATHHFYSLNGYRKQKAVHNRKYNNFSMRPLNWLSPSVFLKSFFVKGVIHH